jgi:hypothetical protein
MRHITVLMAGIACSPFLFSVLAPAQEKQAPVDASTVELIEAGTAPLRELRFTPKPDATQTAVMTMGMNQAMSINGQKIPSQNIPETKFTIKTSVDNIAKNGEIEFSFFYSEIDIVDDPANPSPLAATMRTSLQPMVGTAGDIVVNNRGLVQRTEIDIPDGVPAQLKQVLDGMKNSMNQLSSPLPVEPVGVGGKWRVVQTINANGLRLKQTSTHEITQLTEHGFSVDVTVTQDANPQEIKNDALPPTTKINLTSLKSTGNAKSTIALDSVFPIRTTMTITSQTAMGIEAAGQNQDMTIDMKMELTLETLP